MRRFVGTGLVGVLTLACSALLWMGCGSDVCSNDAQCGDKICYQNKCMDRSVLDSGSTTEQASEKPATEPTPDTPAVEKPAPTETPVKEEAPEQPAAEKTPEAPAPKVGIRKEGESCDPRREGHAHDLCGPGLECAELEQTSPSSGAPQPSGVCLKACSAAKPDCPTGFKCSETLDTKTRQKTGLFVCAKEADAGESCVNINACKTGLSCIRFGTTGTSWFCQKDCTKDASACGSGEVCKAQETGSLTKICKPVMEQGKACAAYNDCNDKTVCASPGNTIYNPTCQSKCGSVGQVCAKGETCGIQNNIRACYNPVKTGEQCNNGPRICENSSDFCAVISPGFYNVCRKRCSSNAGCAPDEGCDRTRGSATKVCQPRTISGNLQLGAVLCQANGRPIGLGGTNPVCLTNCSNGTATDASKCGSLTPGILRGAYLNGSAAWAVGEEGLIAQSTNSGAAWSRFGGPVQTNFTGMAVSGDGKIVLISGIQGTMLRSEDAGKTWTVPSPPEASQPDLWSVSISMDGKLALAVGAKGAIWRSEDGGKTWNPITVTGLTENLHAVSFGRDKAGAATLAIIVGEKGKILRSEDGGKTWKDVVVTGVTDAIWGLAFKREAGAGLAALAVGDKGLVLESTDDGKTWKKIDSKRTETLRAAVIAGDLAWVVGNAATTLSRDKAGAWTYAKALSALFSPDLHALTVSGTKAVAVGSLGTALYSADGGKTWTATATKLLRCLPISSNGQAAGGICGFLCNTNNKGKDCPPHLQNCREFNVGNQKIAMCSNSPSIFGYRKAGESCAVSSFSPLNLRCNESTRCIRTGTNQYKCLETCDLNAPKCSGGKKCVYSVALGQALCGEEVAAGGSCDWGNGKFCENGSICRNNPLSEKWVCEKTKVAKLYEHCYPGQVSCEAGLVCTGDQNIPYRRFCTKTCDPTNQNSCDPGFQCLSTSGGGGICIEKCTTQDYKCKVPSLTCRRIVQTGTHCY